VESDDPFSPAGLKAIEAGAEKLGVELSIVPARTRDDLPVAFATMVEERVDAVLVVSSPLARVERNLLAELELKHRLPVMFGSRWNVEAGGLISYAADLDDLTRRATVYIDKILKGTKPADLPVEQASKYQLIINLKTAKALRPRSPVHAARPCRRSVRINIAFAAPHWSDPGPQRHFRR
jgi:putative ABC transport system substrate-binding protein